MNNTAQDDFAEAEPGVECGEVHARGDVGQVGLEWSKGSAIIWYLEQVVSTPASGYIPSAGQFKKRTLKKDLSSQNGLERVSDIYLY